MNLTQSQISSIEAIDGVIGFLLLQSPQQVHYSSESTSKVAPLMFGLLDSLLSLSRLTSRGRMEELSMNYQGSTLKLRCVSEGQTNYFVGLVLDAKRSDKKAMHNTIATLAS